MELAAAAEGVARELTARESARCFGRGVVQLDVEVPPARIEVLDALAEPGER